MALKLGRQALIKIDTNDVGGSGASWSTIGQQISLKMDFEQKTAAGETKADSGADVPVVTGGKWSGSFDGKFDPADSTMVLLKTACSVSPPKLVWLQIDESSIGGTKMEGQSTVKMSLNYEQGDLVTYSITFEGKGYLVASVV